LKIDASVGGSVRGIGGSANFGYAQEKSVSTATDTKKEMSDLLAITQTKCITSKVYMRQIHWNRDFLDDIRQVDNSTESCSRIVKKYGTHYYRNAQLGGKLLQVTSISREYYFGSTQKEVAKATENSFGASVSAYGISASASTVFASSQTDNTQKQSEFETKVSKSSIVTYGGAPGSFGTVEVCYHVMKCSFSQVLLKTFLLRQLGANGLKLWTCCQFLLILKLGLSMTFYPKQSIRMVSTFESVGLVGCKAT
jgi:hypothetical protein